jgi:predicted ArsR family transcriptional regulator
VVILCPVDRRLQVFKVLGDNTRYAIYLELARSETPLSTIEIAETLDLHPNTVRPHLDRMRDVGLVEVEAESRGTVGRPQHRWSTTADAPSLGLEPSGFRMLSTLLAGVAAAGAPSPEMVAAIGRQRGRVAAEEQASAAQSCLAGLMTELSDLGFDPTAVQEGATTTIGFTRCPFADLAAAFPNVVCHLHRGMVEGYVEAAGGASVEAFHTLEDRDPCRVDIL